MSTPGFNNQNSENRQETDPANATPDQGRSAFSTGTTTQGGSNYGQGSSQLGGAAYEQGSTANEGSNYKNEAGKLGSTSDKPEAGTQQGGGAGGYDAGREQQEVNKEREDMNSERNLDDVDVERPNTSPDTQEQPTPQPGKPSPGTSPR